MIFSTLLMSLPVWVSGMKDVKEWRYVVAAVLTIQVGVLYTFLSVHSVLTFLFPVTLMTIYGDNKLKWCTIVGTFFSMSFSHILSVDYSLVFDDPYVGHLKETLIFALTPRLLIFSGYVALLNYISDRNQSILNQVLEYAKNLYRTQAELVEQFAIISESKSGQTGQHIRRVGKYMEVFADELGIVDDRDNLVLASMMHDVGKLWIPGEIIEKPAKLTKDEFAVIKKHTKYGFSLLEKTPGRIMELARTIALEHHERYDGGGYDGKKGEEIDYYSRIMSIVDVFDAMLSVRSYKPAYPPELVYEEIVKEAGGQFDPELVEVFKRCYPRLKEIAAENPD
ncbi:MAG: HD domain-containing protein [Eubacteriales bacterium]